MNALTLTQVVEALNAKKDGDSWVAQCVFPENHNHGDANPSLVIGQDAKTQKVLAHCRGGCDKNAVWRAILAKVKNEPVAPLIKEFKGTQEQADSVAAALPNSAGQRYLESRGISLKTAQSLGLGFISDRQFFKNGDLIATQDAVVTPHHIKGEIVALKLRGITEKIFDQVKGSTIDGLYAVDSLDLTAPDVYVFEGDMDVALARSHGLNATGILSAQSRVSSSDLATLKKYQRIFLVGDQDIAGKKAMDALEKQLPVDRVIRVRLPGFKDVGELYQTAPQHFAAHFKKYVRLAQGSREYFDLEDLLMECEIRDSLGDITPYIVEKLIPANSISMFFGEEKSGKSLLMVYILKCIANGVKVFGTLPVVQRPVIYLDMENSTNDIAGMIEHFTKIGPEPIRYKTRATGCPELDNDGLVQFCERYKPVLVLDSLTKFAKVDMFNPSEMSEVFDKMLDLCAAGATILLIHHATRADAEKYSSSHQIGANVSRGFAVLSLDRPSLHRVRLEPKLFRGAEPVGFDLIGFPAIKERGAFVLAQPGEMQSDEDLVIQWIASQTKYPYGPTREDFKRDMKGMRAERKSQALSNVLEDKRVIKNSQGGLVLASQANSVDVEPEYEEMTAAF